MKDNRPYIILAIVLIGMVALFSMYWDNGAKHNWQEHYRVQDQEPYGTIIINSLLQKYFPNQDFKVIKDGLKDILPVENDAGNYVFVGEAMYLDSTDTEQLLQFVEAGNNAFISSKTIPFDLINYIYYDECEDAYWDDYLVMNDTTVKLNFQHPLLKDTLGFDVSYFKKNKESNYRWAYFADDVFCEEEYGFVKLGDISNYYTNFAKAKYGDGTFYLHTTPISFTNISLLKESGLEYATRVFSHLTEGAIYWDDYSRIPESVGRRRNSDYGQGPNMDKGSELEYILSQPPLAWAWYLGLGLAFIYLIFRAKRRQRIIPVLAKNENTSLAFIGTIGRLNFIQNNHRKLALQKMKLFLGYIRERYYVPTKDLDAAFVEKLSHKSEVPKTDIDKILLISNNIEKSGFLSENSLVKFHQALDRFYKNCK